MAEKARKTKDPVTHFVDVDLALEDYPGDRDDLANATKVGYQTLVNWNSGRIPRAFEEMKRLCDATGKTFEQLLKLKQ